MPAQPTQPDTAAQPATQPKRPRFRALRLTLLLLVTLLISLCEPRVFQALVRQWIGFEAWRQGVVLHGGTVESTLFEPLLVTGIRLHITSPTGSSTRIEIDRAEAQFAWRTLFSGNLDRWFDRLTLSGVVGKTVLPASPNSAPKKSRDTWSLFKSKRRTLPMASHIEIGQIDYTIEQEGSPNHVRIERSQLLASPVEAGVIQIGRLTFKEPWFSRTFRDVRGTTAIQGTKLIIADAFLEPELELTNCSAELADLAQGILKCDVDLAAFGGEIRGHVHILPGSNPFSFSTNGSFSKIGVAKLATFLGLSDAAGGTIKEGKFNFRGSPSRLEKTSASLWLDADNFQWESRQWDSLAFGASLMDRRIQISKLDLAQGPNRLNLSGEMALPLPGIKWWQNEFTCNIAATIEDLTQLSALVLPDFKFAAGKAKIDGSIRGRNKLFNGQLIVSGSKLRWRNAPIENLHAALRLDGNECQINTLEIFNNGDYVRGRGLVNIVGATHYEGELSASIADLATYSAILQKPLVPEPMAGRALIDWSGEGSANGHSGKFVAKLNKVRTLGTTATQLHPINVDMEGNYTLGSIQFSRFALSDDESSLTANVGVGKKAFSVQQIRLTHGKEIALQGDAFLPLDVWQRWPNTSLAELLNSETVAQVHLKATALDLRRASQLTGWKFPVAGTLNGSLDVDGSLTALKCSGSMILANGQLPIGWNYQPVTDINATATFDGDQIILTKASAKTGNDPVQFSGSLILTDARNPKVDLAIKASELSLPLFTGPQGPLATTKVSADVRLQGTLSAPSIKGDAQVTKVSLPKSLDLSRLWTKAGPVWPALYPNHIASPWNRLKFDVNLQTAGSIATDGNSGTLSAQTHLGGTGASPALEGRVDLAGQSAMVFQQPVRIQSGALTFGYGNVPSLDANLEGTLLDQRFSVTVLGPVQHTIKLYAPQPGLPEALLAATLEGNAPETGFLTEKFGLQVPPVLTPGIVVYPWERIVVPPTPEPATPSDNGAPAPAPAPANNP